MNIDVKMKTFFSQENRDKLSEMKFVNVRLKNNFDVGNFMSKANLDYLYSIQEDDSCLLLNVDIFGQMPLSEVLKLAENKRLAIISTDYMEMLVFNVEEREVINSLL
jgi:NDP-sugar pyrophosphorylase family protein